MHRAAQWLPAAPLLVVLAVAVAQAVLLPPTLRAKAKWVLVVAVSAVAALALAEWQHGQAAGSADAARAQQLAQLRALWAQWDAVSRSLPSPPDSKPAPAVEATDDALAALSAQVARIRGQIELLREQSKGRLIDGERAGKLAEYLRPFGPRRVVVSCPPDDAEAYAYANQLANILRAAGWDALGPEVTATLGATPSYSVRVYVRDPSAPDAARILLDAFGRFNIPCQPGIASNEAIPDTATAELFVAKQP